MAWVGCLGDLVFQVSDETVETLNNAEWSGSARYAVHQRHLQNALTEFTGLDPDKFTLDVELSHDLGVNVMDELVKIWTYERKGQALAMAIGDKGYGKCRWSIVSHKIQFKQYDRHGNLYRALVSLELQEYLRV